VIRVIKFIGATLLFLVATFTAIGEASLLFNPRDAKLGEDFDSSGKLRLPWYQHASTILFVSACFCGAYLLVRRRIEDPIAEIHCPRCLTLGAHKAVPTFGRSISPVALHFGGLLLSVLYSASRSQRFKCRNCDELFYSHTRVSRGYQVLFLLIVGWIAVWVIGEISEMMNWS
jgi:hypothetical protein